MLIDLQRVLIKMLTGHGSEEIPREAASLTAEERAMLEGLEPDGFRLTSLLVRKLRFERICRGDLRMEEWFDHEPASFTEAFQAYNREVPPTEFFPRDEARAFRTWCEKKNIANPLDPPASKET